MTDNMKFTKGVILLSVLQSFPDKYLESVFCGGIDLEMFGDIVTVEFIKRAYDNSAPAYPLRHFVHYENNDSALRMLYSRVIEYVQKYRDREYRQMKQREYIDPAEYAGLQPQAMDTIKQRLEGYKFTTDQFEELNNIHDIRLFKAITSRRIVNTNSIKNDVFKEYMAEYDAWVKNQRQRQGEGDEAVVSASLEFFTVEWKYAIELVYLVAKYMEDNKIKTIHREVLAILCGRLTFDFTYGHNIGGDSRAAKERQKMIPYLIKEEEEMSDETQCDIYLYKEMLGLLIVTNKKLTINNQNLRSWFAVNTSMEDWASFFRDYNIFEAWHEKNLTNGVIRNMRKIFGLIIQET